MSASPVVSTVGRKPPGPRLLYLCPARVDAIEIARFQRRPGLLRARSPALDQPISAAEKNGLTPGTHGDTVSTRTGWPVGRCSDAERCLFSNFHATAMQQSRDGHIPVIIARCSQATCRPPHHAAITIGPRAVSRTRTRSAPRRPFADHHKSDRPKARAGLSAASATASCNGMLVSWTSQKTARSKLDG